MVTPRPPRIPARPATPPGLAKAPGLARAGAPLPATRRPAMPTMPTMPTMPARLPAAGGGAKSGKSATPRFAGPPGAPKQKFGKSASNVPKSGEQPTIPTKKPATRRTPTAVKGKPSPGMKGFGGK